MLISIPILLVGTFVAYVLVAASGDPLGGLRARPGVTQDQINAVAAAMGLDQPIPVRYWTWLTHFVRGDWGQSLALGSAGASVYTVVMKAFWVTFRLVVGAEVLALVLGAAVGVLAAVKRYSVFDYLATLLAFLMFSMPVFCVAIVLKYYAINVNNVLQSLGFSRWLTTAGPPEGGFGGGVGDVVFAYTGTYLLPTITLMAISFAAYSRFQRSSMLDTLNTDYVRTARAKGLSSGRVILRHAARTALIPVTTLFAVNFGLTFGGAIVTEHVFGWHGMGSVLVAAVEQYDPNMLMGWLVVTAVLIIACNLLADLMYGVLDPRIRRG